MGTRPLPSTHSWREAAQLGALSAFAFAQPLFDLLARHPSFLEAHRAEAPDLLLLSALLVLAPPAAAVALLALARRVWPPAGAAVHGGLATLGVAAILLPLLHRALALPGFLLLLMALVSGIAAAWTIQRVVAVGHLVTVLAASVLLFPALFLLRAPIRPFLAGASSSPWPVTSMERSPPVVFLIFDSFPTVSLLGPDGGIDAARLPNFAALARDATWFRNATTVHEYTSGALPAILAGRYPPSQASLLEKGHPARLQNLFVLLGGRYSMNAIESFATLCPRLLCSDDPIAEPLGRRLPSLVADLGWVYLHLLLPADLTRGLPQVTTTWRDFAEPGGPEPERSGPRELARLERAFPVFIDRLASRSDAILHFAHLMVPHVPWDHFPSGTRYGPLRRGLYTRAGDPQSAARGGRGSWRDDAEAVQRAWQRHLSQVGYADHLLGRVLERLREAGLYDEALVIVTADHGIAFHPGHPVRSADERTLPDILQVPLLIKRSGQREARVSERNVETIDILPTVADALGFQIPLPVDGRSLFELDAPERRHKTLVRTEGRLERRQLPARLKGAFHSATRMHALFDLAPGTQGLFRIGPAPELVGRSLAGLPREAAAGLEATIQEPTAFDRVDPEAGYLPANVIGELHGPAATEVKAVALALNGTLWAVTHVSRHDGGPIFDALLPEEAFRPGPNRLEAFAFQAGAGIPRLREIAIRD